MLTLSKLMWTSSESVLARSSLPFNDQLLLTSITWNRAVLLMEIPSSWVPFDLSEIHQLTDLLVSPQERSSPQRYIPGNLTRLPGEHWTAFVSRSRPPGWSWLEVIAAKGPTSGHSLAKAIDYVFLHSSGTVDPSGSLSSVGVRSFQSLCSSSSLGLVASSLTHHGVDNIISVSEDFAAPRKRIRLFHDQLTSRSFVRPANLAEMRFPGHLLAIHSIRIQMLSVRASWKSVRSGLLCWGDFMGRIFPHHDHLSVEEAHIRAFASIFRNSGSLGQYLSHIRMGIRLAGGSWSLPPELASSILRGLKKITIHKQAGVLSRDQFRSLIHGILHKDRVDLARFVIVAHHYMHRVQSELFPLQLQGDRENPLNWHSSVHISRSHISIRYHHRKNAPNGASISRTCICLRDRSEFCGVCALRAQIREVHPSAGDRIFPSINLHRDLALIRRITVSLGVENISWHSFRRSSAQDMLKSGCTISQIIRSGGWRSGAFVQYLNRRDLDDRAHLNFICHQSDSENEHQ